MLIQFVALAAVAATGGQFNLNCSGTMRTIMPSVLMNEAKPYSVTYRIDLDAKKWCEAACTFQHDLASVSPINVVLTERNIDTPREHNVEHNEVSRETGDHHIFSQGGVGAMNIQMSYKGTCEKSPFGGFPSVPTKF